MTAGWRELPFDEVLVDVSAGQPKTHARDFAAAGRFPVVDQGQTLIGGYTDDEARLCTAELPLIVFGDHTRVLKYVDFPFAVGAEGVKLLRPRGDAEPAYLYRVLKAAKVPSAGYSRHFKYLKRLSIPLPPIEEQRRIAAVLDQADELRAKRRTSLGLLDELRASIFLDMFGDPARNPHRFPMVPLGELAVKFSDGPFGSNLKSSHYAESGVRVIRLQNIGVGKFLDEDRAYIADDHFEQLRKHECLPGDILVGTLGVPNLRACIQPVWLAQALNKADCVQVRVDPERCTPTWLSALLNQPSTERMAQGLVLGQTRARISMGRLKSLAVPVPSLRDQQRFSDVLARVEGLRQRDVDAAEGLDELSTSLQQRAFAGRL